MRRLTWRPKLRQRQWLHKQELSTPGESSDPVDDYDTTEFTGLLAEAEDNWQEGARPSYVTAVAASLGLDPDDLDWHVEAVHGWEPHDTGYPAAVWAAARCTDPDHLTAT